MIVAESRIATIDAVRIFLIHSNYMSTATKRLSLEEFRSFEAASDQGPRYEYWSGEAIPKSMPTWLHSELQVLFCELFRRVGYYSAIELELRISNEWQPKPDVVAALNREFPYPTKPVEIVADVLSEDDERGKTITKCRNYHALGIKQIFVFDPRTRTVQIWNPSEQALLEISRLELGNGVVFPVSEMWVELDRRLS